MYLVLRASDVKTRTLQMLVAVLLVLILSAKIAVMVTLVINALIIISKILQIPVTIVVRDVEFVRVK